MGTLAEAGVAGAQATAAALVAGADNSQAVTLHATYTLCVTLANLEGAANGVVSGATSYHLTNADIDLGTLAVAGVAAAQATAATAAAALLAGADNSPALTLHATYTLSDTLANLAGAGNGVVSGATSYHLTDANIDLGTLAVAGVAGAQATAAALVAGADNSQALTLHATYTLSDTLANLEGAANGVVSGATSYHLTNANIDLGTLAVAGVAAAQAAAATAAASLLAGADNSPALTLHATYTLSDTLVNLEGAGNGVVSGATSYHLTNADIDLGTLAVAGVAAAQATAATAAAALLAGADNSPALTLHATYTLSDTLANLEGAANGVVSGAISYHLTNANIDLGTLAVAGVAATQAAAATAAASLLAGADNSPALTLHATYTLSDTLVNLEGAGNGVVSGATSYHLTNADIDLGTLAVAGVAAAQATAATAAAALLAGADNSPALTLHATYTLSDTLANLESAGNGVVSGATSYHLTDANIDLGTLAVAGVAAAQAAAATAAAALLAGADNSPALTLHATYTLSDTLANLEGAANGVVSGATSYHLTNANIDLGTLAVAGVAGAQAAAATAAAALLAGADNSPALTLHATYTLSDTLVNLEGAGNGVVSGATSYHLTNADIDLGTLAVAGVAAAQATAATAAAALLAGADNSPALTLHATYTLSDTLANLAGAGNGVVSGATSYHLTDANIDLGTLAVAGVAGAQATAATLVAGADNSPALTLHATYTLSDTLANLEGAGK